MILNQIEMETTEQEILEQYFSELLPQLNFRLFLDMAAETGNKIQEKILWVESITITAYEPPEEKPVHSRWKFFKRKERR